MNLSNEQKQKMSAWIAEGLKLSDIQKRLETEFGLRLTYLDVRLLVDDLKLMPKDLPEREQTKTLAGAQKEPAPGTPPAADQPLGEPEPEPTGGGLGAVSVTVDRVARPGAVVSGAVSFSDGQNANWVLDQYGRLGVVPKQQGYKPSQEDLQAFQAELQQELQKMGL